MDPVQFEDFLKQHGIVFKDGRWRMNSVPIPPKNIIGADFFRTQSVFRADEAELYLNGKMKSGTPKISPASLGSTTIAIFLDELAKDPKERKYLDRQLPQMVVDNTLKKLPYDKDIPASILNETDLIEQYKLMMDMNKKTWGAVKNVETLFSNYTKKQRLLQEREILSKIKFDPNKIAEADQFLGELYNLYQPAFVVYGDECRYDFEFFKGVIRHLIWNIKTKAWLGVNKYPFMLNLSGEQGNGKTSFVSHLCQDILQNMFSVQNIDVLNDDFGSRLLADQWVLFFDEMVRRHGNIDIDKLKQTITNNQVKTRIMFSQKFETTRIRCVFIGSANRPIYEIVCDETGNRRYLNIEFRNSSIKSYRSLHAILDKEWSEHGLAIWQSVDESAPNGYLTGNLEVLWDTARNTYVSESNTILQWMAGTGSEIRTSQCVGGQVKTLDEAYQEYKQYWAEKDRTARTMAVSSFKKFIKDTYNARRPGKTAYTPGELRVDIGVKNRPSPFMPSSDEIAGNLTGVPPILDKYKEFVPVDLGPGQHLTDFAKVPNASADGANVGANVANAASGAQSAVSDQISPIPSDNKVDIGNIGKMSESNRNLVLESGVRSCAEQFRQHCQHGDPAINDFDFGTSVTNDISPVMEPTEAEIQWYKENYGDDPENMEPENDWSDMEPTEDEIRWYKENYGNDPDDMTPEEEAAYIASVEALTSYLRDWWTREKERRAKERSADDDDFFKRLSQP